MGKLRSLTSFFLPQFCPVCGKRSMKDGALCEDCFRKYSREQKETCAVCGKLAGDCLCGTAHLSRTFISGKKFVAVNFYRGYDKSSDRVTERMIGKFKKKYDRALTDFFAREISGRLLPLMSEAGEVPGEWTLTYPPRSPGNLAKYGFDQSEAAVRSISRYTGIPWKKTLFRVESGEQKGLGRADRAENAGSLRVLRRADTEGKKIILFDDVITTGATVAAATDELIRRGAEAVFPVCIARTQTKKKERKKR